MEQVYHVDLGAILDELGEQISLDEDVTVETFVVGDETFAPVSAAHIDVAVTNTGAGVVAQGDITVDLKTTCSRCLGEFVLHAVGDVEGFYVTPAHSSSLPEEQEFELIRDRGIDLMPALLAALTVELPFAPVHDPDCLGICPKCGVDRNTEQCDCSQGDSESPFAGLRDLLSDS